VNNIRIMNITWGLCTCEQHTNKEHNMRTVYIFPCNTYPIRRLKLIWLMSFLPHFCDCKVLEMKHVCWNGVKYCKTVKCHIYMFWLLVIINPIRFLVLVAMLCTLSCGYSSCTECHAIYFKPIIPPFPSPALIIIVA